jgi:RNA polymerase sigma factor (sigma-70 family)
MQAERTGSGDPMAKDSTNQALKQIWALYALGPLGGLTDARLIERFLDRAGPDAEDAFAVLVQRHGPMVLAVCRRMLPGSADAEDAFQAVFLVLARRAGSIRRVEGLKSWLYGVAVRTAKEARRRAARRRAREGGTIDRSRVATTPDESKREFLALLDEELHRLPGRYRDPLLLCELAGTSRQDAARHLGLPEGTLSSRLSRGRSLLRDRLTRRGVALGTGALATFAADPASASFPESLVEATARLALAFTTRGAATGTIPATVASLAEGVLIMIARAKLKLALAAVALGAVGLTFAWAEGPKAEKAVESKVAKVVEKGEPPQAEVRGIVVDEVGRAVADVEVVANPYSIFESRGVTGADGSFAFSLRRKQVDGSTLLARSADGDRLGVFRYRFDPIEAKAPARIVLKPSRAVTVRVDDPKGVAIGDVRVEVVATYMVFADATTGPDGSARLHVPADAKVQWILAMKSNRGFDYAEFVTLDEFGRAKDGEDASALPATVFLTLDDARTVRIQAIDTVGKPMAGVGFVPWMLQKPGRRSSVYVSSRIFTVPTGPDGIATFDWLPSSTNDLIFWPQAEGYVHRRVIAKAGETELVTAKLIRTESIRGRVVHADGSPAPGVEVNASGSGQGMDNGQARVRTAADGTYEMTISPREAYAVSIEDKDWTAAPRFDVVVREGRSVSGVDFTLIRGTVFRGSVTAGPNKRPVPKHWITLIRDGGEVPKDLLEPGDQFSRPIQVQIGAMTDESGHFSTRLAPGTYTVIDLPRMKDETIVVKDEAEIVRDYKLARPEKGPLSGRVVLAGSKDEGIAEAKVEILSASGRMAMPLQVFADKNGRFQTERGLDKTYLCAHSPDGSLGGVAEIDDEAKEVVIVLAPTASATGILLDPNGKPVANEEISWGRYYIIDEDRQISQHAFVPKVKTDANGRFHLPDLVVGEDYPVSLERNNRYLMACLVHPESPGPIDLGTVQAGAYKPSATEQAKQAAAAMSSFRNDAPGAGKLAPVIAATTLDGKPLGLDAFKGKYVLLDFWATWCAPCIAEIPRLRAIHDEFGEDGRFAILSLSVDEKIDEPRTFQAKHKLPWTQAFLGKGIHGPQPESFGIIAIPAFVLIGPDGKIVARGMRGDDIKKEVIKALGKTR